MIVLAIYIFSLAGSACIFGGFVRQVLGGLGYVRGLDMAVALAAGAGLLYACAQLAYMTALRALKPTSSPGPAIAETMSHASALVLLPYLLGVAINWPHPLLARFEPLIYVTLFVALHIFFKLASFFAAVRGEPGGRIGTGGWLLAATLNGLAAFWTLSHWFALTEAARPQPVKPPQHYRAGDQYALALELPEGATVSYDLTPAGAAGLTFRWAPLPDAPQPDEQPQRIFVTARLVGDETEEFQRSVVLDTDGWAQLSLPPALIPKGLTRCDIVWEKVRRPAWQSMIGFRPLAASDYAMLCSGPFLHADSGDADSPNFLIIVVDGLASRHVSAFGYPRKTTPALDALVSRSLAFPNAYTPAPEASAACMTLLTGVGPLRHGFLGANAGPLPESYGTLAETMRGHNYVTAAFTEGIDDLALGLGFERGFELFDPSYVPLVAGIEDSGSRRTLEKASEWLDRHDGQKFLLFVRVRELADPVWSPQYEPGFANGNDTPDLIDVYDSALKHLDKHIGALISRLRSTRAGTNTCIVVTSPYGIDFTHEDGPVIGLTEESLRVPLIMQLPAVAEPAVRQTVVGLDSVAPTLLTTAMTGLDHVMDGISLPEIELDLPVVSVYESPAVFSMRRDRWRFYWHSGVEPFTNNRINDESEFEAMELEPIGRRRRQEDETRKTYLAEECLNRFRAYIK